MNHVVADGYTADVVFQRSICLEEFDKLPNALPDVPAAKIEFNVAKLDWPANGVKLSMRETECPESREIQRSIEIGEVFREYAV